MSHGMMIVGERTCDRVNFCFLTLKWLILQLKNFANHKNLIKQTHMNLISNFSAFFIAIVTSFNNWSFFFSNSKQRSGSSRCSNKTKCKTVIHKLSQLLLILVFNYKHAAAEDWQATCRPSICSASTFHGWCWWHFPRDRFTGDHGWNVDCDLRLWSTREIYLDRNHCFCKLKFRFTFRGPAYLPRTPDNERRSKIENIMHKNYNECCCRGWLKNTCNK